MGWRNHGRMQCYLALGAVLGLLALLTACAQTEPPGSAEASGDEAPFSGAALIDDSNRNLIGSTIQGEAQVLAPGEDPPPAPTYAELWDALAEGGVIAGPTSTDLLPPSSIAAFSSEDGVTLGILMINRSCAVFSPEGEAGWPCRAGDRLSFAYASYHPASMVIGYLKDGVLYGGEKYAESAGTYELEVQEDGTYQIYVMSVAPDYLALKEGRTAVA